MKTLTLVLAVLLPVVLSQAQEKSPSCQTQEGFGNKRRVEDPTKINKVKLYTTENFNDCGRNVVEWVQWDEGFLAKIWANGEKKYKVEITLDSSVELVEAYDADIDASSGYKFTVTSRPANDKVNFVLRGRFAANTAAPKLKKLMVGDEVVKCNSAMDQAFENGEVSVPNEESGEETTVDTPKNTGEGRGVYVPMPDKVLGLYILLADDSEEGFESNSESWTPELYPWQQEAANVLFFTFIHPETMDIPPSFKKLAATRGTNLPGAVPADTVIIFAIGGYSYSLKPNPWKWLTSKAAAEAMAEKVAKWPEMYGIDGIDLDLEEGAGARKEAGPNMIHFIRKLRELQPNMIISQPVYGYPQVQAETDVINASWDSNGVSSNLADTIGLMVYEGTQALNYVKNYINGSGQWQGFPVTASAPSNTILLGAKGSASAAATATLARESVARDLRGIMVWYASVKNGFQYAVSWDATPASQKGYIEARKILGV